MKISISILFLALFLSLANSSDTPCPDNGYRVDYKDPYSSTKKSICYTTKNGKDIKHGPEIHRNETGKVIKKLYYHYGQATTAKNGPSKREKAR